MDFTALVQSQHDYFLTGATRPVSFREAALRKLRTAILDNRQALELAMEQDFHKPAAEVYMTEIGMVLSEIRCHLRGLPVWAAEKPVPTPLSQFPARSFLSPEPYGSVLILAPWNYPIQLCLTPLVGAISAGNCAVVKPSAYTPATSRAIARLLSETFDPAFVAAVEGGRRENQALLDEPFDYIFFTGSKAVGRLVMEKAAQHLTPVTLELGGKSPVIVDGTADLRTAARRVMFGKVLNAGQTCVEPDYAFVREDALEPFLAGCREALAEFFPDGGFGEMPVIVNEKHYARVKALLSSGRAVIGGGFDDTRRFIEPTVLTDVSLDSPVMQEEIFGPILPVIVYSDLQTCIDYIRAHDKPLALYLFTRSRLTERLVLDSCSFGGGCINDTIVHLASDRLPFGGVGASGMGSYHGRKSFEVFSHTRSILKKPFWPDLPMRYHPYTEKRLALVKAFLK